MTCKHFLALLALTATFVVSGQTKEFYFSSYQASAPDMHWKAAQRLSPRSAKFSDAKIVLHLDKAYQLTVREKNTLPTGGIVYLCKDEQQRDVTITLISEQRMFLYAGANRFQVNFSHPLVASSQNSYAEND